MKARRPGRVAFHRSIQTVFAVAAIAAAVALPVVLLSVGGGVFDHELASLENSGYVIAVSAPGLHGIADAHRLAAQIDALPTVAAASPILSEAVDIFVGNSSPVPVLAEGIVPRAFEATEGPQLRGLFPSPLPLGDPTDTVHYDNGSYAGTPSNRILLSSPFAGARGISTGDSVIVAASTNRSAGTPFLVAGTFGVPPAALGPTAAFAALLPLSDLQTLVGEARSASGTLLDAADTVQVGLLGAAATDPSAVRAVANEIQSLVPYYGVSPLLEQAAQLQAASSILKGFYLALSSVGLSVGLIFLLLVLLRRVDAERRNLGIRRAIGEPAASLARLMLGWAATLAGEGVVGGVASGVLVIVLLSRYGTGSVRLAASLAVFDPVTLGLLGLGVVGLGLLAGLAALRRALTLDLPEVLR